MRLIAFGGDERMRGALLAAGRAGWETLHIEDAADVPDEMPPAQAVMLPWPRSFREERLISAKGGLERERVLALIPACRAVLAETARDTPIIELASAPYGLEMQKAVKLGLQVCVESGLPGRYAPLDAGEALFDALTRAMGTRKEDAQCAT